MVAGSRPRDLSFLSPGKCLLRHDDSGIADIFVRGWFWEG